MLIDSLSYLLFASIYITVISIQTQIRDNGGFSFTDLFTNKIFFTLIVSMLSTYVLYLLTSLLFLDPWHMFTCFLQYLLLTPTYINILNVYAFCNTHDITWGTKGDDKPEKLPAANLKPGGKVDVAIPTDDADLNTQYESELRAFSSKYVAPKKVIGEQEKHEDYYKGFRSAVVLVWMFCNLGLSAIVLNTGGVNRLTDDTNSNNSNNSNNSKRQEDENAVATLHQQVYLSVVLYSVAVLAAVRFIGACWFLVTRLFRGV